MYSVRGSSRIRIILTYLAAHCFFHTCLRSLTCIIQSLLCIHMLTCGGRLAVTVQHQLTVTKCGEHFPVSVSNKMIIH